MSIPTTSSPSILILRDGDARSGRNAFDVIQRWMEVNLPAYLERFRIVEVPQPVDDWAGIKLMVPWLLDPVQSWSTAIYDHVIGLQKACDERGIPVINRVERLTRAGKLQGAGLIARSGLRTPRIVAVTDVDAFMLDNGGLMRPLLLREDWGHQGPMLRVDADQPLPESGLRQLKRPVAMEIVDVRNPVDGMYRLRRHLACGPLGVSLYHLRGASWVTRRHGADHSDAAIAEERLYTDTLDPWHDRFQAARRALGLDMVAFDYGLDTQGQPVVWEANPYTHIRFPALVGPGSTGDGSAAHRAVAAVLVMYFMRAGLTVHKDLVHMLGYAAKGLRPSDPKSRTTADAD